MNLAIAAEEAKHFDKAYGTVRSTVVGTALNAEDLRKAYAYWQVCTYLMLVMICLQNNSVLKEPLKAEHIKTRLLGQRYGDCRQKTSRTQNLPDGRSSVSGHALQKAMFLSDA